MPCLWEGLENNWLYSDNPNKSSCTNYSMLLHIQIYLQFLLVQYPPCNGVSNWGNIDVYTNNPDMFIHDDAGWKQGKKCCFVWAVVLYEQFAAIGIGVDTMKQRQRR